MGTNSPKIAKISSVSSFFSTCSYGIHSPMWKELAMIILHLNQRLDCYQVRFAINAAIN
jgi:hypothetical protein